MYLICSDGLLCVDVHFYPFKMKTNNKMQKWKGCEFICPAAAHWRVTRSRCQWHVPSETPRPQSEGPWTPQHPTSADGECDILTLTYLTVNSMISCHWAPDIRTISAFCIMGLGSLSLLQMSMQLSVIPKFCAGMKQILGLFTSAMNIMCFGSWSWC